MTPFAVIVKVVDPPCMAEEEEGFDERTKSGLTVTWRLTPTVRTAVPFEPWIVSG